MANTQARSVPLDLKRFVDAQQPVYASVLAELQRRTAHDIFGSPDDLKFHSSMTMFSKVSDSPVFPAVLDRFFDGKPDHKTLAIFATKYPSR